MGRRTMTKLGSLLLLVMVTACGAQPKHVNIRSDPPSQLAVMGGPVGAVIQVDGVETFRLTDSKQNYFTLPNGSPLVVIEHNGRELYRRTLLLENGTRKVIELR